MIIHETSKSLIKSLFFLIFGALIFAYPNKVVIIASQALGTILILYGIFLAIKNYYDTKQNSDNPSTTLMVGIVSIIFGVLFIVLAEVISNIIQYVVGGWILFTGIERIIVALQLGKDNKNFITQLVVALLLIMAGLYTILRAHIEIQILGIIMMTYAVLEIIGFVTNKQEETPKKEKKEEKEETEEEPLKIETKDKKDDVKDAKIIETKDKKKKKKK